MRPSDRRSMPMLIDSWDSPWLKECILQLEQGVHEYDGHGEAEHDHVDEEERDAPEQRAHPGPAEHPPHRHNGVNRDGPAEQAFEDARRSLELGPSDGRLDSGDEPNGHCK